MKKNKTQFKDTSDHTVPLVPLPGIVTHTIPTKSGNTLLVFYNRETNLLIVDIMAANEKGGNELVRMTLDEKKLLAHCK